MNDEVIKMLADKIENDATERILTQVLTGQKDDKLFALLGGVKREEAGSPWRVPKVGDKVKVVAQDARFPGGPAIGTQGSVTGLLVIWDGTVNHFSVNFVDAVAVMFNAPLINLAPV